MYNFREMEEAWVRMLREGTYSALYIIYTYSGTYKYI